MGIPQELVERLIRAGGSTRHLKCVPEHGWGSYMAYFDREVYKAVAFDMVEEAGMRLLLRSLIGGGATAGARVTGIRVASKSGFQEVPAQGHRRRHRRRRCGGVGRGGVQVGPAVRQPRPADADVLRDGGRRRRCAEGLHRRQCARLRVELQPLFEHAYVSSTGVQIGVRESGHILGK